MQIVADLHLHSRYSRAVSQKMDLFEMVNWAEKKGIDLVATGDWMHPVWFKEISTQLKETQPGIFALKDKESSVRFILSVEISSIYSQGAGKVRRVHNLIFSPSLASSEKLVGQLTNRGAKLMSDGRPIVGISSKDLLALCLEIDPGFIFVPAHAWTPWFGIYGSQSGFDSLSEAFGDLAKYVYAVETGLSSDPLMNWQIKELENRSLLSFSDAHSGPKLGREATVFINKEKGSFTYSDLAKAIKQEEGPLKIGYTIEFFPEEGKYHWSGHRDCGIHYSPKEIKEKGLICPVCSRPLTIGVENRVLDLAHRQPDEQKLHLVKNSVGTTFVYDADKKRVPFVSLIPLLEILLEINNNSPTKSAAAYENLIATLGTEFDILMKKPYDEIKSLGGERLEQAIRIVRERRAYVDPGYDGVFGKVKIFPENSENTAQKTTQKEERQLGLF